MPLSSPGLLLAFPKELVLAIAGFALLASIAGGLHAALADARQQEAAIVTFLVTLSGVTLLGVGSAFWGVAAGAAVLLAQKLPNGRRFNSRTVMQLLFIADPLASFNTKKDTTFAMMRKAQRQGYTSHACQPQHLQWQAGGQVEALV